MAEEVQFKLTVDDQLSGGLQKAENGFKSIQDTAKETSMAFAGIAAVGVVAMKGWIDNAEEADRTTAQLNQVLISTHGAVGLSADAIQDMAKQLAHVTTMQDDTIAAGQNMLLTFTNIGKDAFPRATSTMLDMATAMNNGVTPSAEQLKGTAIQLGKALNDPEKGMTALTKVGVTFTEQQKQQIETLQKSGDMLGAQTVILDELGKEFGGQATAQAKTFEGQMENLQNRVGEITEDLGHALIPILQQVGTAIGGVVSWFESFDAPTKELIAKTTLVVTGFAAVGAAVAGAIAFLNPVTLVIIGITAAVAALYVAWETNFGGIRDITQEVFGWLKTQFAALWGVIGPGLMDIVTNAKLTFDALVKLIQDHWDEIVTISQAVWDIIQAGWELFWDNFKAAFEIAWAVFSGIYTALLQAMRGDWGAAWATIQGMFSTVFTVLKQLATDTLNWLGKYFGETWDGIVKAVNDHMIVPLTGAWNSFWQGLADTVNRIVGQIQGWINDLIKTIENIIGQIQSLAKAAASVGGAVYNAPGNALNSVGNFLTGKKAEGGAVSGSGTYLVGENGPEIFKPNQSGSIVPNRNVSGGGGSTIIINMNGPISSKEVAQQMADEMIGQFQKHSMAI